MPASENAISLSTSLRFGRRAVSLVWRWAGDGAASVLASALRCDREVRCETGAAPATVSGELAATATDLLTERGWEGAAGLDTEPGDIRFAAPKDSYQGAT